MNDCIFCKIIKGEVPCVKVFEDGDLLAFLDIAPINKGHTLVIPKQHYETIDQVPKELLHKIMDKVQDIAKALLKMSDGVNVQENNKKIAGQLVPHVHFHVIPRHKGDGFKFTWEHKKYEEGEMEEYMERIVELL